MRLIMTDKEYTDSRSWEMKYTRYQSQNKPVHEEIYTFCTKKVVSFIKLACNTDTFPTFHLENISKYINNPTA